MMMKSLAIFKGVRGKGGGAIPAPAKPAEASSTLDEVRDVRDRRSLRKTGRVEYFGVRVVVGLKSECEALAGELSAERKQKVTLGALMDEMLAAYRMVRGDQGAVWRGIEEIAAREGLSAADVVQHLVAEKLMTFGQESDGKRKRLG